jgi:hypothetical protein
MPPTGMILRDPSNNSKSPIYQRLAKFAPKQKQQPDFGNSKAATEKSLILSNYKF